MPNTTPRATALPVGLIIGLIIGLNLCGAGALAQQPAAADGAAPVRTIELGGDRDPDLRPYQHMLQGAQAFDRHHRLAPAAALRFILRPDSPAGTLDGVTLGIGDHNRATPLPFDADGSFTLPRAVAGGDDDAALVTNRRRKAIRWAPHIHSPGVAADQRRLGDLRLHCEVLVAVLRADLPAQRQQDAERLMPGCASPALVLRFKAARPLAGATLVSGQRRLALPISQRGAFAAPLGDASWNDEALVEFSYAAAPEAAAQ